MNRLSTDRAIADGMLHRWAIPPLSRPPLRRGVEIVSLVGLLLAGMSQHPVQAQQVWQLCGQLGEGYREIYAFPTPSYYVNICERSGEFYYVGQSRQSPDAFLQLPAHPISRGSFFAEAGRFNYSINDLRDQPDSPNQFELVVTRESPTGEVEILRREYSIPPYIGEDPTTMCDPVVETC